MVTLRMEKLMLPAADLGPENPLPFFRTAKHDMDVPVDPNVPEEDRRRLGWEVAPRVLPYRMQDGYDRVKKPREFCSIVLENENLRATFLPALGGRLVSLVHKPN